MLFVFEYICYLPDGRSVLEKYFVEVSKTAVAKGRGTLLRRGFIGLK